LYSHNFEIVETDPQAWSPGGMGRASQMTGQVHIRTGMPSDVKDITLLHEVIHLIFDMNGIELKDSEVTVSVIANGMFSFLRSNPEIAKRLGGL
jgi:hypothetical protein